MPSSGRWSGPAWTVTQAQTVPVLATQRATTTQRVTQAQTVPVRATQRATVTQRVTTTVTATVTRLDWS